MLHRGDCFVLVWFEPLRALQRPTMRSALGLGLARSDETYRKAADLTSCIQAEACPISLL